ncbi:MAG: ABC transporter permease subunit [Anaerolineales bacterium]|nr:ABC transporter permease subunit [Anaerolineales bacterium]
MVPSLPNNLAPRAAIHRERLPLVHLNWALLAGALLVALVVFVALAGPKLAPHDPQETNAILRVGTAWVQPPFAPFAVPGFPLGSDERGRDIYSLLLWAARPTLVLVGLVAAVRLLLGLLIGLAAGWSAARLGRLLDLLISAALTAPVLIVALAVVAVLGVQGGQGLWAFILGLSLTGWAETARVVRELTRGVRGQAYVEAARALGATDLYLLARHALPHVLPMAWVLLAFEVSATILTVAGLGFLGYYTNDVWMMISDTTAQRFAGLPDLGQMLSTVSSDIYTGPYKLFAAGSLVFLTVLGFNLLGAGLRQQLNVERVRRRTQVTVAREWLRDVVEDHLRPAFDSRWGQRAQRAVAIAALAVIGYFGARAWLAQRAAAANTGAALAVPGGHLWATERRDPYGTRTVGYAGPVSAPRMAWSFLPATPTVLVGGPAVAADGTVYVHTREPALYALNPADGSVKWSVALADLPVGSPALGPEGQVYVAGEQAGLLAFAADGVPLWRLPATTNGEATGGPMVGLDGTIYYTIAGQVQAVTPAGQPLWRANGFTRRVPRPPALTAPGYYLYLRGLALAVSDGSAVINNHPAPDQMVTGGDGRDYALQDNLLAPWTTDKGQLQMGAPLLWEFGNYAFGIPTDVGVLADGTAWFAYLPQFQDARFVYVRPDGTATGFIRFAYAPGVVVGLDDAQRAYICGTRAAQAHCLAAAPAAAEPLWDVALPGGTVTGGAIAPGRLYVSVLESGLFALTEGD